MLVELDVLVVVVVVEDVLVVELVVVVVDEVLVVVVVVLLVEVVVVVEVEVVVVEVENISVNFLHEGVVPDSFIWIKMQL